jgi:rhodanese-related sulfurtransferase
MIFCAGALVFLFAAVSLTPAGAADKTPRISAEVVKALIGNPEISVIDVRRASDYEGSATKIKSAVRESEKDISWAGKYDKERILVLYCA